MIFRIKNWIKLFSPQGKKLSFSIQHLTGLTPVNIELYKLAFLHKSVQRKNPRGGYFCNERLEFLGDAILGAVIAKELYSLFPEKDEGALTKLRSQIVNRSYLNHIGRQLELHLFIETQTQIDLSQTHILGDAVEALIGAVFLDHGYNKTTRFVKDKIIGPHLNIPEMALCDSNYKSILIEWGHKQKIPVQFNTQENRPNDDSPNMFLCSVLINGELLGEGSGNTKKEAQQNAARFAFESLNRKPEA